MSNFLVTTIAAFVGFYALALVFFLFEVVFGEWAGEVDKREVFGSVPTFTD
jgi:hypothetical protein